MLCAKVFLYFFIKETNTILFSGLDILIITWDQNLKKTKKEKNCDQNTKKKISCNHGPL
jgi:hypothetical protein